MKLFTKNTFRNLALSALSAAVLSACGGAGSCTSCVSPTPAPGELTLSIAAPTQYPAGLPTPIEASLTMTNTSSVNASNLVYTIPAPNQVGNYTGVVITPNAGVGSQSGACTNIAAGASCTFTATIAAYANPGSFTVTATPNGSATQQAVKTVQVGKALQADSISVTANLGLVDIPNTNNEYYILPSDQTIQGSSSSATTAYVSVLVKAAGEGLNRLKLVDETGADLPYVTLGTPHYTVNSVNSYAVTIPAGKTIQHIQALSNVCTTLNTGENNNSACSNDADVNLAQSGIGILAIQPNYFQMSESRESQIVTLQNVGTANITSLQLPQIAAPFSVLANTCSGITTLAPLASCTVTIGYTLGTDSGQGSYVVNYNNGTSAVNTSATIPYVGTGPAPYAILTASPTSFSLSESHALQRITVTNTGTASATAVVLPTLTAPLIESATSCKSSLAVSDSCTYDVYINYSQSVTAGEESVTFAYNNGQSSQTTSVAADWIQSHPQFNWSSSSSSYFVLSESIITLTGHNLSLGTKVTLSDASGDLILVASPNDGNNNVCDFTQNTICHVTISGGNSTSSYTVTGTATNSITVPSLAVTLSPVNNYIADYGTSPSVGNGNGYIWQCQTTHADGQIDGSTCQSSRLNIGIPFAPIALAFNKIGDTQYVYIDDTNYYYGSNNIWTCTVNSTTGAINSDCVATNGGITFQDPYNLNIYNGKVYITDWGSSGSGYNVYMCTINQSGANKGQIDTCTISNGGVADVNWNPDSIAFYSGRAYIADYWNGTIYTCNIDVNGLLQNCSNTGNSSYAGLSNYPTGISFSSNRAYIADWYGYQLASCDINDSGDLVNCTVDIPTGSGRPEQITYRGGVLFAASGSSGLLACQINSSSGIITSCAATPTTSAPTWNAGQVVFNPFQ